ncbi:MAG: hypothetical protein WCU88_07890 [Elusimicrobiota bacterium]|jgi:hypothetical protein
MRPRSLYSLSIFIIGCLLCCRPISSFDLWWELAEARWIAANLAFPTHPLFTYTLTDFPYIAHEWASGMVFYGIRSAFSELGLLLFVTAAFGILCMLFYRLLLRGGAGQWGAWLYTLLFLVIAQMRFPLRPELFSSFAMMAVCFLAQDPRTGRRQLAAHFAVFALWANFHGEFAFGIAYLLISWISTRSSCWGKRLLAASLGSLCNPYGWKVWSIPFFYFFEQRRIFETSTEGQLVPLHFIAGALITLLSIGLMLWERFGDRSGEESREFSWRDFLLTAAFGFQMFKVNRLLVLFCIVAMPILYFQAARFLRRRAWTPREGIAPAYRLLLLPALIIFIALWRGPYAVGCLRRPLEQKFLPEKAAGFLEKIQARGKIYNSYSFGGYLEWRLFPRLRPFYDGRYPYTELQYEETAARESPEKWQAFISRYDADFACIDWVWEGGLQLILGPAWGKAWEEASARSPYSYLLPKKDWTLLYWDERALVFARNTPGNREIIRRCGLRYTEPLAWPETWRRVQTGEIQGSQVLRELAEIRGRAGPNWLSDMMSAQLGKEKTDAAMGTFGKREDAGQRGAAHPQEARQ